MGIGRHVVIHDVIHDDNEMGNRPISYQDVALQIFYASIFYPFANFRQLATLALILCESHSLQPYRWAHSALKQNSG